MRTERLYSVPNYDGMSWDQAAAESVRFIGHGKITSTDYVIVVLNANPGTQSMGSTAAFFESGSNAQLLDGLLDAGWSIVWIEADYYYCVKSPTGDTLTYIEGDVVKGNTRPEQGE